MQANGASQLAAAIDPVTVSKANRQTRQADDEKDLQLAATLPSRRSHSSTQEQEDQAIKQSSGPGHDGSSSSSAQGGISSAPALPKPLLAPRKLLSKALKPLGPIPDIGTTAKSASLPPRAGSTSSAKAQSQALVKPVPLGTNSVMVVDGKIVPIGWRPTVDGSFSNPGPIKTAAAPLAAAQKPECDTPHSGASDAAKDLLLSLDRPLGSSLANFSAPQLLLAQHSFSISIEGTGASPGSKAPSDSLKPPKPPKPPSDEVLLLEALNAWRASRLPNPNPHTGEGGVKHKASSLNSILPDAVIQALTLARPKSIVELQRVPGMTSARVQKLGHELLDVVRQHLHSQQQQQLSLTVKARKDEAASHVNGLVLVSAALGRTSAATSSNTSAAARMVDDDCAAVPLAPPLDSSLARGVQGKATSEGDDDSSGSMMQLVITRKEPQAFLPTEQQCMEAADEEPLALAILGGQNELMDHDHGPLPPLPPAAVAASGAVKQPGRPRRKAEEAGLDGETERGGGDRQPKKKSKRAAPLSLHPDSPMASSFKPPFPGGPAFLNRVSDAALKQYSSEEDRWILKQVAAGMPESEVAAILRRSRNAIVRRVRLLIARATSAGSAAVTVAPAVAPSNPGTSILAPPAPDVAPAALAPQSDALAVANPSEEAAAVKAILNARAAAALARSTTSLPQHLIEPLIQYLRGDNTTSVNVAPGGATAAPAPTGK